jgi:hypothetical protein
MPRSGDQLGSAGDVMPMETNVTSVRPLPRDWAQEYAALSVEGDDLSPEDLERYATAAHLLGKDEQTVRLLERAHSGYLDQSLMPLVRSSSSSAHNPIWLR